jgi:RNA polymerase sigma factor (sigma-70 family)
MTGRQGVCSDLARFRGLYDEHFDAVARYARARADPDTAKDATAQTFLVAWRRRTEFFSAQRPLGWLLGVTRRTLADERRAVSRQSRLRDRMGRADTVAPLRHDPAVLVTERDAVAAAFRRLGAADREVLALIAWDGLAPAEAAGVVGCSRAAFAVRLHRARARFRAQLGADGAGNPAPAGTAPSGAGPPGPVRVLTARTAERNDHEA